MSCVQEAFSLLAYSNPWDSPVGWQLEPIRREPVCSALNAAILGTSPYRAHALLSLFIFSLSLLFYVY